MTREPAHSCTTSVSMSTDMVYLPDTNLRIRISPGYAENLRCVPRLTYVHLADDEKASGTWLW